MLRHMVALTINLLYTNALFRDDLLILVVRALVALVNFLMLLLMRSKLDLGFAIYT